jgi:hypothetical protein
LDNETRWKALGFEGVEWLRALDLGHSANSVCAPTRAGTIRVLDLATRRDLPWAVVPDVSLVPNVESAYLWDLAISPDGTSLLYARPVNFHANLWMLENFR